MIQFWIDNFGPLIFQSYCAHHFLLTFNSVIFSINGFSVLIISDYREDYFCEETMSRNVMPSTHGNMTTRFVSLSQDICMLSLAP